ncbi:MAG: TerC family protein [Chitinophagales bacterium]|nr:TerC family protein [Chitinophagales bacterium]
MEQLLADEKWLFIGFSVLVVVMLALDLGFFNRSSKEITNRQALIWCGVWVGLAVAFGIFVFFRYGETKAAEFFTAYLIEEALSVDNLFVFILIFSFFQVPSQYQHKVLFWGILGAIVFRAIFIFSGVWLIEKTYLPPMEWFGQTVHINVILTLFGFFLLYAGIKSFMANNEDEQDFSKNPAVRLIRKILPVTESYVGSRFFTKIDGKRYATPLLLVVGVIELTDVLFAVDSIPAIFSVSKDPLILYTSNIFAILGLRTLYFLLNNFFRLFHYLKYGLGFILAFIGVKMVVSSFYHISSALSLSVVAVTLVLSVLASIWRSRRN